MKRIAIEEHFTTQGYQDYLRSRTAYPRIETVEDANGGRSARLARSAKSARPITPRLSGRLLDLGPACFAEMDSAGIDMQVVMLAGPGVEDLADIPNANAQAREINDVLAAACRVHPKRLAGFATLSYGDPQGAAKELQRSVTELGLKATKINSHCEGEYLDEKMLATVRSDRKPGGAGVHPPQGTTSGLFGAEAFDCVYRVLGADRILYAVDYPDENIGEGARFMDALAIPDADKAKICPRNAEQLLAL